MFQQQVCCCRILHCFHPAHSSTYHLQPVQRILSLCLLCHLPYLSHLQRSHSQPASHPNCLCFSNRCPSQLYLPSSSQHTCRLPSQAWPRSHMFLSRKPAHPLAWRRQSMAQMLHHCHRPMSKLFSLVHTTHAHSLLALSTPLTANPSAHRQMGIEHPVGFRRKHS